MASLTTQELFAAALSLPEAQRAELARNLLESLDDGEDISPDEWTAVWSDEIERRMDEIRSGKAKLIDGDEALRRVRDRLQSRSK
jgi:putative addiction module component (TIGR02574 family)